MWEVSCPWPKPSARQERRMRYVFVQYDKSFNSSQIIDWSAVPLFSFEFIRQIGYRLLTIVSEFSHAAIVVITDNDYNNERPDGNEWEGVCWHWGRRRVGNTAVIHRSGEARVTEPDNWSQNLALRGALDFRGITQMTDEQIGHQMNCYREANKFYELRKNNCENFCDKVSSNITILGYADYEVEYMDSRVSSLFRQTRLTRYKGVAWRTIGGFTARLVDGHTQLGLRRIFLIGMSIALLVITKRFLGWSWAITLFFILFSGLLHHFFTAGKGGGTELMYALKMVAQGKVVAAESYSLLEAHYKLARAYQADKRMGEAVELLDGVVAHQKEVLAEKHPYLLMSQHELARAYREDGQVGKAIELLEHVVEFQNQVPVAERTTLRMSEHDLAEAYKADGQVGKAVERLEHVVKFQREVLVVEDHPILLASQLDLAEACQENGQVDKAETLKKHVASIKARNKLSRASKA